MRKIKGVRKESEGQDGKGATRNETEFQQTEEEIWVGGKELCEQAHRHNSEPAVGGSEVTG